MNAGKWFGGRQIGCQNPDRSFGPTAHSILFTGLGTELNGAWEIEPTRCARQGGEQQTL